MKKEKVAIEGMDAIIELMWSPEEIPVDLSPASITSGCMSPMCGSWPVRACIHRPGGG